MPIRISWRTLHDDEIEMFNGGKFARTDYTRLYTLVIDKGDKKTFHQLMTPDFVQLLYSIKVLWNAHDGDPYNRHDHPAVLVSFDNKKEEGENATEQKDDIVA
jgi:hypothetical protein